MAIIVDKEQKRKDIALACKNSFLKSNIHDLLISDIALEAGVGKGTLYNYFNNKEEILFELANILLYEHDMIKKERIKQAISTKDKMKVFSSFFYSDETEELRELYKKFLCISLSSPTKEMQEFQKKQTDRYNSWMEEIIQDGVDNGEIIPESIDLIPTICAANKGLFLINQVTNSKDILKDKINLHIETLFMLIKVNK